MTVFGVAWGHRQIDISPVAKLAAIYLGDASDHLGRGLVDLGSMAAWCCTDVEVLYGALKELSASADCQIFVDGRDVEFMLPHAAQPERRQRQAVESTLVLYVMKGRIGTKVGITANLQQRLAGIRASTLDDTVEVIWSVERCAGAIRRAERRAHAILAQHLIRNEWFSINPETAIVAARHALTEIDPQ